MMGEKAVRDWLKQRNYTIFPTFGLWEDSDEFLNVQKEYETGRKRFFDIDGKVRNEYKNSIDFQRWSGLDWLVQRSKEEIENTRELFTKEEQTGLRALNKDVEKIERKPSRHHSNFRPDILARIDNKLTFIEVKANESKLEHYQKMFLDLAKKHGFQTRVARVSIRITTDVSMTDY